MEAGFDSPSTGIITLLTTAKLVAEAIREKSFSFKDGVENILVTPRARIPPPPWRTTRKLPRELQGAAELPHKLIKDFMDASIEQEIIATGIKVINLLAPYYKGDKTGLTKAKIPKAAEVPRSRPLRS